MELKVYRGKEVVALLPVSDNSNYSHQLMGEHKITCNNIQVTDVLDIQLRDYILYDGRRYDINTPPGYIKYSNFNHEYNIIFESIEYRLYDKKLMQNGDFVDTYFGNAWLYVQLIVDNINEIDTGWSVGLVDVTPDKHIEFTDKPSCRSALTTVAEAFGLEYYFDGKVINMVKSAGAVTSLSFSQGKGNGLYTFELQARQDINIVTRVYGYGGTRNIPADYRLNEAGIPATKIRIPSGYIEHNVDLYGVKEGIYENEEIFPRRTGTLSGAGEIGNNTFFVTDDSLDFNINDHLLEGLDAKVSFKSGDLAGYEFTISRYDHASKTLTLNIDKSQPEGPIPNKVFVPQAGDTYVLIDIRMPQEYVQDAEDEAQAETEQFLADNSRPLLVFTLNLDELHVKRNGIRLNPGDRVKVVEPKLGVDSMIRTTAVTWPLLNPNKIKATIADFIPYTRQERIIADTIENKRETIIVDRINAERARRTAAELRALKGLIRDPDDYFDVTGIKPGTIETLYLAVGAKSQNFGLNNVVVNPNAGTNPNNLYISAGQLIHYEIEIEGLGYIWQMSEAYFTDLDPDKAYYVAAKCERTALRGTWSVTEDFKATEQEPGVWYFNLGILYPVKDGYRNFDITKGMTTIVGDTITTGKLQSIDKINFFNLTNGTFNLGEGETGMDYGITTPDVLTIKKSIMAGRVEVGSEGVVNAFISGITDEGEKSIRFAAGKNNKFRVLDNGDMFATNVTIEGDVTALLGHIGGFRIDRGGIRNDTDTAYVALKKDFPEGGSIQSVIGTTAFPDLPLEAQPEIAAYFANTKNNPNGSNLILQLDARNSKYNIGLESVGIGSYGAFYVKPVYVNSPTYTCSHNDHYVIYLANTNGYIYLPPNPLTGMVMKIRKANDVMLSVFGNGNSIKFTDNRVNPGVLVDNYSEYVFIGSYWAANS